jgi:hypothetical protein
MNRMENKLLELFEKQDTVSMNDDIFPLVEEEFAGQVMSNEVYELAHQYINQLLWGVFAAGINFIASPVFGSDDFGKMVVTDMVYEKVTV